MAALTLKGLAAMALLGSGWMAGSLFPAPADWTAFIRGRAEPVLAQLDLSPQGLARLRETMSPEQFSLLSQQAALLASTTGDVIRVEHADASVLEEHAEAAAANVAVTTAPQTAFQPTLRLCPGMTVSNAPAADADDKVRDFAPVVDINGVALAVNPTRGACLSSGVGQRNGHRHKGLDLHARDGGPVLAGGDGVVLEQVYRPDYGNMVLIDHGSGVYTRYAHLSSFAPEVSVGASVRAGQQIGLMGNTAAYPIPVHLHYEVLLGDYSANNARSFGLTPRSPFEFPAASTGAQAQAVPPESVVAAQATRDEATGGVCAAGPITEATIVTIRPGDTLFSIARACYRDAEAWRRVAECNAVFSRRNLGGVSPLAPGHLLYVGDRLVLPAPGEPCPA